MNATSHATPRSSANDKNRNTSRALPPVDVASLFEEVAAELGLKDAGPRAAPPGPSISFRDVRLHDQPVAMDRITDDVAKVTAMQQNLTLSGDLIPTEEHADAPAAADTAALAERHRRIEEILHPPVEQPGSMRKLTVVVMGLTLLTMLFMAWVNNILNPFLPDSLKHVRPSVEEYIHGRAR
jgi:hypothetical protein